ncbi:EAL domain-containing protein [Nocardioides sp. BP30]|uniref:sensor domain-containing phosphodiesterase n=1 Tax=Nocardioides sp. BP30 TaxID=3036374 RepID=UPI00246833D1|nr:EAL domain-containing protein [Nocardioides sp. BP30]WGL50561.1 EAL domain-containing protein [Nocardioides sp. BP30]
MRQDQTAGATSEEAAAIAADVQELRLLLGRPDSLRSAYQPIVELATGAVVGYEALARGPVGGRLERPDRMFAAAATADRLADLDWACRTAALSGADTAGLASPYALFVNVEPAALGSTPPTAFVALAERLAGRLPVVVEFTERALTADPARLLAAADTVRAAGWRVAIDDIGAERGSLALMPFIAPDVLKLDLRLVQQHTTIEVAEVVSAVNAQAERTGAVVLAEGIETPAHARLATEMGARLGQGWLFGRPGPLPALPARPDQHAGREEPARPERERIDLTSAEPAIATVSALPSAVRHDVLTPYELVARSRAVQQSTKPLLVAMSKHLERQAMVLGGPAVVAATFQHAHQFTPATARRYARLAESAELVVALGLGMPDAPAPGVCGAAFDPADPIVDEWSLVVVGPHFAGALLARDLGDPGEDAERRFDYVVTYDRELVVAAASALLRRVSPASRLLLAG